MNEYYYGPPPKQVHINDTRSLDSHLNYLNHFMFPLCQKLKFIKLFNMEFIGTRYTIGIDKQGRLDRLSARMDHLYDWEKQTLAYLIAVSFYPVTREAQGYSSCGVL